MSEITPALAIAPGVATQVPIQPNQNLLVLDNLSTFALQVTIGANVRWQAPLVEDAYPLGSNNQPISITPVRLAGDTATAGTVTPTFYETGEVPLKTWPIALSGPAEVAAATAAALLAQGIPQTFSLTPLFDFGIAPGASPAEIDVHTFGSLFLTAVASSNNTSIELDAYQNSVSSRARPFTEYFTLFGPGAVTWQLPVISQFVDLTNRGPTSTQVILYGSNRLVPQTLMLGGTILPRHLARASATTSGTPVILNSADNIASNMTTYNVELDARLLVVAPSAGVIDIGYQYTDNSGVTQTIIVGTQPAGIAGTSTVISEITQPKCGVQWVAIPRYTSATTSSFDLQLTPSQTA